MKSGTGLTLFLVCTTLISGILAAFYLWRLKRQQSALAMREQTYRSLTENLPDNIARWDAAGRYIYVNAVHEQLLATPAANLIGKTTRQAFPDGRFAPGEVAIAQVIATGKAELFMRQAVPVKGETRIHDIHLIPEWDAHGQLVSVLGIGRDMTDLYRLQDDLVARERELRALAESSPGMMGSFYSRPDGAICMPYVSPNIEKLFGLHPQDVKHDASSLMARTHPDDTQRVSESIAQSALNMSTWHEEYRILHPTLGERWMESNTNPEHHPEGGIVWYGYVHDITERKQQQQALLTVQQENEQRMLNYFESAPGFFYTLEHRPDGHYAITFASPGIRELFGIEPQAVMQSILAYLAVVHPEDVEMGIRLIEQAECALSRFQLEYRIHHPRKGLRWMEAHAVPQRLPEGGTCWNGFIYDITDRKHLESALKQSEQEFRSLAESSPDFIVRYDRDGRSLYFNSRLLRHLGHASMDVVVGKRPNEVWPDGRFADLQQAVQRAMADEVQVDIEIVEPTGRGTFMHHQIFVVPERGAQGQIVGAVAFGRDITAIREAERKLAHFIDNLPGLSYTFCLSPEGRGCFPYVSSAIEDIYGLKPEDVKDDMAALHALAHPDDQARIEAAIAESIQTMRPFQIESRVCRPGQPERWIDVRSVPEHQPDGSILWYGIMLDITERKHAELEREAFRTQLRGMAARQDKVREEERRHIAREVHDELGQILSALKLNTIVLTRKFSYDLPALRQHLTQTMTLTDQAIGVARNIATALRPVALDMGFVPALEWLAERVENNTGMPIDIQVHDKNIDLDEQHAIALFRIVQEALTNITRHAQAQRVTIVLKKDAGDDVLIVRDDGTGFDPRIRKENSFGLVGMQERALMLGGTLSISSRTGGGTEITVRIPVQVEEKVL